MRVTFLCVLLLAGQVHGGSRSTTASAALTIDEFVSALDALTAALSDASPADADAVIAGVPVRWPVNTGSDEVAVDGTWIIHALRAAAAAPAEWTDRRRQIIARIAEIRAHAADRGAREALDATRARTRTAVATVLERREFQRRGESWLEALQRDIA